MTQSDDVAVILVDSPPVNTLSAPVRSGLMQALAAARSEPDLRAVVLICEGRTFFAGADINELGRPVVGPDLIALEQAIEASLCPVVAAIHGTALGGGLELALACHYRVAAANARLGLPEVMLGLLPGAGGTQRLPRLVGPLEALRMMATGEPVGAAYALKTGLVDMILPGEDLQREAVAFAKTWPQARGSPILVRDRDCQPCQDSMFDRFRLDRPALFRGFRAPGSIVEAVKAAARLPFDQGMAREAELFSQLLAGRGSAAQRHIFFAERRSAKLPDGARSAAPPRMSRVAVFGSGALADRLVELLSAKGVNADVVDGPGADRSGAAPAPGEGALEAAELIVLAGDDGELLRQVGRAARADAVLACADGRTAARHWPRPDRLIGLGFFPSVRNARLIEVQAGTSASAEAAAIGMRLARRLGCAAILSRAESGSVVRRAILSSARSAQALIRAGHARRDLDEAMTGFGFPEGWLALAQPERRAPAGDEADGAQRRATPSSDEKLIERLLFPIVNECAGLLAEGHVRAASDLDVALVAGCGWPAYEGGPMFWADGVGLDRIVASLDVLADELGEHYRPTAFLRRLAAERRCLSELRTEP